MPETVHFVTLSFALLHFLKTLEHAICPKQNPKPLLTICNHRFTINFVRLCVSGTIIECNLVPAI